MNIQQMISRSSLCLLGLLGLTLFASPVAAQVFDTVINVPPSPDIGSVQSIGDDGLTTQLNVSDGGSVGWGFDAYFGSEVNISGGTVDDYFEAYDGSVVNISGGTVGHFTAFPGSEVNISGGSVGDSFCALNGSVVNITGGSVGSNFDADSSSAVNLLGSDFVLDGVSLDGSLVIDQAFTIVDRNVTLSGLFADGSAFSFDLNSVRRFPDDYFDPNATLTVTLVSPALLGDCNLDGVVDFLDIHPFIWVLSSNSFLAEADCDENGVVDFLDIAPFIAILTGQ